MRRNVFTLVVSLGLLLSFTGCSLFKGKKKEPEMVAEPMYQEPAPAYQPMPDTAYKGGNMSGGRTHTVAKKDTLYSIARLYYNDQGRWKAIYEANRAQIPDPNRIRVGQQLVIP